MSPSSVCNTEELETGSGSGTTDFHPVDIGHESSPSLSEVEIQTPELNLPPSSFTIIIATIPAAIIHGDEPLQLNSADRFSHIIPVQIQHMGQEQGIVLPLFQILENNGERAAETSASLGKTIVSMTFQAGVGLVVPLSLQNSSPAEESHILQSPLHVVQLAMVIGFAASFMGILLRHACPVMARKMEKTGYLSAALGFFVLMSLFLPHKVRWIGWIASAASLVAFILPPLISYRLGLGTAS